MVKELTLLLLLIAIACFGQKCKNPLNLTGAVQEHLFYSYSTTRR